MNTGRKYSDIYYNMCLSAAERRIVDKLVSLDFGGFWDSVRDLTKRIRNEDTLKSWKRFASIRYAELEKQENTPSKFKVGDLVRFTEEWCDIHTDKELVHEVLEVRDHRDDFGTFRYLIGTVNSRLVFGSVHEVSECMIELF